MQTIKLISLVSLSFFLTATLVNAQISFNANTDLLTNASGSQFYPECAVDMNGDYLDDIVRVATGVIYIDYQETDGSFTQQSFPLGLQNYPGWSFCAGDIDNNGFNDLLFGGATSVSFIYANADGTAYTEDFHDEYIFSQRSTFADIDNNGYLDAFTCHDVDQSHPYRNDGNGNLVLDQTLIETADLPGNYAAIWVDYDNDGLTDLYVTKCKLGSSPGDIDRTNLLYKNNGDGTYSEVAEAANMDDNAQSWATVFEDFDNDGDFDAFIVNHDESNRFMKNLGNGTFEEIISETDIDANDLGAWENASGDFDNDGYIDILAQLDNQIYRNNGDMTFTGMSVDFSSGGIGDFNNDGFLDVVTNNPPAIHFNETNDNNWVKINTQGIISNKNGIGARVEVHGDWGVQIREVRAGESFSPMSSLTTHFGIGQATAIDQILIKWPSGITTNILNPAINTTHNLIEAECLLDPVSIDFSGNTSFCPGESIVLNAPAGFASYLWSNGATGQSATISQQGNYNVVCFNSDQCAAISDYVNIEISQMPTPSVEAAGELVFCEGESVTLTAIGDGLNPTWSNGMTGQSIEVSESGDYFVSVSSDCFDDPFDSEAISVTVIDAALPVVTDIVMAPGNTATLTATTTGSNLLWFDQASGGTLLGEGSTFETPILNEGATYYVATQSTLGGDIQTGGKIDDDGSGGLPSVGAHNFFDTWETFTLKTVTVYVPLEGETGSRTIQLVDADDVVLASADFILSQGTHELDLNFEVPVGDDLSLRCLENNLFRNDGGVSYPYPIGDVGEITTSFYGTSFYYYFYNWQIQKPAYTCISDRVPINISIVALNEIEGIEAVQVFPNPADDQIFISFESLKMAEASLSLFDVLGKRILHQEISNVVVGKNQASMNIKNIPAGVYNLQLAFEDQIATYKIVVQ